MAYVVWKELFSVNNKKMDAQHQKFCDFLNQMHEAVMRMDKEEILEQTFLNLKEYAEQHFSDEEQLLHSCDYPDMATQQQQHDFFVSYLRELIASFRSKRASIPDSTLAFMKDWLLEHILQEDKKYGEYLKTRS